MYMYYHTSHRDTRRHEGVIHVQLLSLPALKGELGPSENKLCPPMFYRKDKKIIHSILSYSSI